MGSEESFSKSLVLLPINSLLEGVKGRRSATACDLEGGRIRVGSMSLQFHLSYWRQSKQLHWRGFISRSREEGRLVERQSYGPCMTIRLHLINESYLHVSYPSIMDVDYEAKPWRGESTRPKTSLC